MNTNTNSIQHPKGRFVWADPKGGITMKDETNMVTNMCKDLASKLIKSLMSGKLSDAMRMRTPAYCHADATYLDCMKFELSFFEGFLFLLKERNLLDNQVERIKYLTVAYIAGIPTGLMKNGLKTPLNPIMGETSCVQTARGSTLYME
jgi:hypothetical protein